MNDTAPAHTTLGLRPLTARSIVLSTLLGHHPPRLPARVLVRVGELFGVAEGTVRVALSRMVAAGDLDQDGRGYGLTARLLRRQARQDDSRAPRLRRWDGDWEIAVVTADRRPAAERAALRRTMARLRLGELREGTWVRPANLDRALDADVLGPCTVFTGAAPVGEDPVALAARLWDLPDWARRAGELAAALDRAEDLADRFTVSAAALRHLLADPVLPAALLPGDWPGAGLRLRYDTFEGELCEVLRRHVTSAADTGE
ncbi:PaaX family transcriptional regulator C-terminal domain-containing protein [Streptomyces sp. DSM 42041]|uniref:PaaX family transcriptional regulator C-terminal domain-containing protein n=1 Tax=Streptomyces hazeniae TaxID=3075538 RepID=A0ABU2NT17_9ACTN|nr:PaaX family transcriptional regulator C-terminal domain-containing protein [Streptomyces sp. DSM 42041]MDT0380131.1 PaaX family transcriptional regulator C-terminal domain-containing protein [Streptomyces sp. DSM 42041]